MFLPLVTLAFALFFQASPDPTVPAGAHVIATVHGQGVQIYRCDQQPNNFHWVLKAPEASLIDPATTAQVGTHAAGPIWTWKDGSSIHGEVVQTVPQPDSIPWLLLRATPVAGAPDGILTKAAWVRRSATYGGAAPVSGCNAVDTRPETRIFYTATYTFYSAN